MVQVRELDDPSPDYINAIAKLHARAFPQFFLTRLGIPFLRTLYAGYLEDSESGVIVAEEAGRLVGFIAYSNDYPRFYKGLVKRHLVRFALCSVGAAIRHPSFIKRLLGAFKKSDRVKKQEDYVELASICVNPDAEDMGIGSALIDYLKGMVDFSSYAYINLETDAEGNDKANAFYVKNGFKLARAYETAEGRRMHEYRYALEGK